MNFIQLDSPDGRLFLLDHEIAPDSILAWGYTSEHSAPINTACTYDGKTYISEQEIHAPLAVFGVEDDPPYFQLDIPVTFRRVYGR